MTFLPRSVVLLLVSFICFYIFFLFYLKKGLSNRPFWWAGMLNIDYVMAHVVCRIQRWQISGTIYRVESSMGYLKDFRSTSIRHICYFLFCVRHRGSRKLTPFEAGEDSATCYANLARLTSPQTRSSRIASHS